MCWCAVVSFVGVVWCRLLMWCGVVCWCAVVSFVDVVWLLCGVVWCCLLVCGGVAVLRCDCAGEDVIGRAQTGSGKTAAFALPMLDKLSRDPFGIFGLVLTPTR